MRKFVNGKHIEMTEEEISKRGERFGGRFSRGAQNTDYETRLKALEDNMAKVLTMLGENTGKSSK